MVRFSLSLVLVCVACAALGLFYLRTKGLAVRSGRSELPGVSAPITVRFDRWGLPHVLAETPVDLAASLGFLHANDRMTQLELGRRACSGRLSELVGKDALGVDRRSRTLRLRATAEHLASNAGSESTAWLEAYSRGVNAWIDQHRQDLPPELILLEDKLEAWSPVDSLCFVVLMGRDLSFPAGFVEENRLRLLSRFGVGEGKELLDLPDLHIPAGVLATPAEDPPGSRTGSKAWLEGSEPWVLDGLSETFALGSNNWAVGKSRTSTGAPLVANDPHLGLSLPSTWYQVHLRSAGFEVAGMTIPGIPGVVIGQTSQVAWAFTNVELDDHDLFLERLSSDGRKVARGERWLPVAESEDVIRIRGGATDRLSLRATDRGPLLPADPSRDLPARSLAWTGYEPGDPLAVFLALARAVTVEDVLAHLDGYVAPAQNLVVADREGGLAYTVLGRLPERKRGDGRLPSPGWDASYGWSGLRNRSENPLVLRPAEDLLVTANHDIRPPGYALPLVANFDRPYRANRIRQRLTAEMGWQAAALARVQTDTTSLYARALVECLHDEYVGDAQRAYETLADWDGAMDVRGTAALFVLFRRELELGVFADEAARAGVPSIASGDRALRLLRGEMSPEWFDDVSTPAIETREEQVSAALARAWAKGRERFGKTPVERWDYGSLHRLRLRHPLGFVPVIGSWFERGPIPVAGSATSIAAFMGSYQVPDQETVGFGPSMRWISDLANPDRSLAMLPGGQSGHPADAHYADQVEGFLAGEARLLAWSEEAIARATVTTLTLAP